MNHTAPKPLSPFDLMRAVVLGRIPLPVISEEEVSAKLQDAASRKKRRPSLQRKRTPIPLRYCDDAEFRQRALERQLRMLGRDEL